MKNIACYPIYILLLMLASTLAACSPAAPAASEEDTADMILASIDLQSPEPQHLTFESGDETMLAGTFYAGATAEAPIVVLMHWARNDRTDWIDYALWLQNRSDAEAPAGEFPALPEGFSAHVFTFDFRGHGESDGKRGPERVLDAIAAIETAIALSGNPAARVVTIGASIGADGAVDGCVEFEQCLGALSLSPGSYLEVDYAETVTRMDESGRTTVCLTTADDLRSFNTCDWAIGDHHTNVIYPEGNEHGMDLFGPPFDPAPIDVVAEFVVSLLGEG